MVALMFGATLCFSAPRAAKPAAAENTDKMAWWNEAKFGLFIHWGPYCLYGGEYKGHRQKRRQAQPQLDQPGGQLLLQASSSF